MSGFAPHPSPDGRFVVATDGQEVRMSHWILTPRIVDAATGAELLRFANQSWSVDRVDWCTPERVRLTLRKYPGNHQPPLLHCEVDCRARTATVAGTELPLAELEARLDALLQWRP